MKPNRDTSRLLLLRLKMDGWALGKSKVFLKYYHVEVLARIYEEQVRLQNIFVLPIQTVRLIYHKLLEKYLHEGL